MKAGIQNNSTRVYNLAVRTPKGKMIHVNLIPGFNVIEKEHWKAFVNGNKIHPYVKTLKGNGMLSWSKELDDKAESVSSQHKTIYDKEVANAKVPSNEVSAPKSEKIDGPDDIDVDHDEIKGQEPTIPPKSTEVAESTDDWVDD